MAQATEIISLDSDSDDAPPALPRTPPPSQNVPSPVALSSDDEPNNKYDDNDDDLLEPSFADKVAALVRSRGQSTNHFPSLSRPSSAGTSSTAVVVDLDSDEPYPHVIAPGSTKPNHVSILHNDDDDEDSLIVSHSSNVAQYRAAARRTPPEAPEKTCTISNDDDVVDVALTSKNFSRSLVSEESDDADFTPKSRVVSGSRIHDKNQVVDLTPDSRQTTADSWNEPTSPVDIDLTITNNEWSSNRESQSQLTNLPKTKPQRQTKKAKPRSTRESDNQAVPNCGVNSDTESVASTARSRRLKKRDRDNVIVVLSRELGGKPSSLDFMGKVLTTATQEKNVTSEVGDLPQPNRVEWRRCFSDRPGYAIEAVAYWYGAEEFVELMAGEGVVALAKSLRNRHPDIVVFVLIGGVSAYCRRTARRRVGSDARVFTKDAVDDCCTALWLDYRLHVHTMDSAEEAAEHVRFTAYAVGVRPYGDGLSKADLRTAYAKNKTQRGNAALCPDGAGGVREETASDLGAVYQKLLALVPGCSPDKAKAIRRVYPSLKRLLEGFENSAKPQTLLEDVQDRSGRRLGPKLAHKIWMVMASGEADACIS